MIEAKVSRLHGAAWPSGAEIRKAGLSADFTQPRFRIGSHHFELNYAILSAEARFARLVVAYCFYLELSLSAVSSIMSVLELSAP